MSSLSSTSNLLPPSTTTTQTFGNTSSVTTFQYNSSGAIDGINTLTYTNGTLTSEFNESILTNNGQETMTWTDKNLVLGTSTSGKSVVNLGLPDSC